MKPMRNTTASEAWVTKTDHPSMGKCYQNFNGGCFPVTMADVVDIVMCKNKETFLSMHRKEVYAYLLASKSPFG